MFLKLSKQSDDVNPTREISSMPMRPSSFQEDCRRQTHLLLFAKWQALWCLRWLLPSFSHRSCSGAFLPVFFPVSDVIVLESNRFHSQGFRLDFDWELVSLSH